MNGRDRAIQALIKDVWGYAQPTPSTWESGRRHFEVAERAADHAGVEIIYAEAEEDPAQPQEGPSEPTNQDEPEPNPVFILVFKDGDMQEIHCHLRDTWAWRISHDKCPGGMLIIRPDRRKRLEIPLPSLRYFIVDTNRRVEQ